MCDEDIDEGESVTASDHSIHVFMEGKWMQQNKDTLQFNGREAAVMQVLPENRLLLLEPDQVKRILQSGEGLRYTSIWTTKSVAKPRKKRMYMTPLSEDLLYRLNSRLDHLSKLLELRWINSSNTALKGTAEERSTSGHSESKTVNAEVHEKPKNKEIKISDLRNSSKKKQVTPERTEVSTGKNKEFVVSPKSLQAISKFSQSNLSIIKYKGRDTVSPDTFDKDDEYCRLLLHRLNPLVELTRSKYIDNLCRKASKQKETSGQNLPLTRFAATLGLVGTEKKQFMCDILERRRKQKATPKIYRYMNYEYATDSSDVSGIQKQLEETHKTRLAKRKKPLPRNAAKRLKSNSVERLVNESILISSSESSDDSSFTPHTEIKTKIYKKNAKKPHTRSTHVSSVQTEESDSQNITVNLRSKAKAEPFDKTGKILRATNTSVVSKNASASNDSSPNTSFNKSLRRLHLKRVTEEAAVASKRIQNSARLDKENAKKPHTRTTQVRIVTSDESEDLENVSMNLRSKDRADATVVKTGKMLHATNTSVNTSRNVPASNDKSPNSSVDKSLRHPQLKREMEEKAVATKQTQNSVRLSESSNSSYVKNRVYSAMEDQIIIDHVLKGDNQTLVKGNMMWKIFAKSYFSLANQTRTWQSLKNRYLKYILPNLKYYGLPYDKEKLLRSSAYIGDIKKKKNAKENSIFKVHPVISASNVLRQKDKNRELRGLQNAEPEPSTSTGRTRETSRTAPSTAVVRILERKRGPASSTPKQSPKKPDPTYSELTRRFQNKAPLLASSSDDSESGKEFQKSSRSGHRKLFYGKL